MASLSQWVWVDSKSWWWTGRPGVLQYMGSQRLRHGWATERNWYKKYDNIVSRKKKTIKILCHIPSTNFLAYVVFWIMRVNKIVSRFRKNITILSALLMPWWSSVSFIYLLMSYNSIFILVAYFPLILVTG